MNANTATEKYETTNCKSEPTHCGCGYVPSVDIIENDVELLLLADVPGAQAGDIDVDYERGRLTIQARVTPRQPEDRARYLVREYGVGNYRRSFEVGEGIDADRIRAQVADGVLTLHLPKSQALQPRRIAVQSAN